MKSSMVILNYMDKNRALELSRRCITFSCIDKVVIVDNCSPDDSYSWLKQENDDVNIEIIKSEKNGGFSYGNNYGAKYLIKKYNPKYILFANTDTFFEENDVIACLQKLNEEKDLGLVSIRIHDPNGNEENSCWKHKNYFQMTMFCLCLYRRRKYKDFYYSLKEDEDFKIVDVVRGSFMCFKTKALTDIDFFDENTFLYYEEDIISRRLEKKSYRVGILTNHYYIHNHIYSKNQDYLKVKRNLDKSLIYYLENYYNLNIFQKGFTKTIMKYSLFEERFRHKLKKHN